MPRDYDHYRLGRKELERYFLLTGGVLFVTGYVFYHSLLVSVLLCLLSAAGIPYYRRLLTDRRKNLMRLQFKDMLYSVASSVTAGRHLPEAIEESESAVSLIHGADSILAQEIRSMVRQMKEANASDEKVLADLALRTDIWEICEFADVCLTCRKTGGDLAKMIGRAVTLLSENIEIQREKEVLMVQKKMESRILAAMPLMVAGLINLSSSDYLDVMYTTATGRILMTGALFGTVFSFLWSMKLTYTEGQVTI